jgi:hypothetical protein
MLLFSLTYSNQKKWEIRHSIPRFETDEVAQTATDLLTSETKQSPADLAPRGASIEKFRRNSQWFIGPDFLWGTETTWSKSNNDFSISSNDPEVRRSGR